MPTPNQIPVLSILKVEIESVIFISPEPSTGSGPSYGETVLISWSLLWRGQFSHPGLLAYLKAGLPTCLLTD